jgi:hydroxypyruvate isomerase
MSWRLRYASHLGFRSHESPLFPASAGSIDPIEQIRFAHRLGFAGVQDALARQRPIEQVDRIGRALAESSLEPGCMLYAPMAIAKAPLWGSTRADDRLTRIRELRAAIEVAQRLGTRRIAIITGADPRLPKSLQLTTFVDALCEATELAERADVVLCLESINSQAVPDMLLQHIGDAYRVVRAVASNRVRLIFDTAHVQVMDGDLLTNLARVWDAVEIVQIANVPGRTEPEQGEIAMAAVLQQVLDRRYTGLVELEHLWGNPGVEAEQRAIAYLQALDLGLKPPGAD